ncbi:endospore germination permease [Gracilibacillus sp. YIM 98692]|uniref:GerAB/ArcD/ProY family transporter n=1 Tax=Gracilibacillus sp. YIM 98692 TaxID=2663532 RepID=UPI0013D7C524|nr:endospore germination permease [Gracilibacillus sp. YIM 98692]
MKKIEPITSGQMASLFFAFLLGSAIINIPQPLIEAAKNGAWISVILANGCGLVLLTCIFYVYHKNPELNFIGHIQQKFGKWLMIIIGVPIVLQLFLMLSYIIIDIGGFFTNSMMRQTPSYMFHFFILLVSALTVRSGFEVMARMFVLLLCYLLFFSIIVIILTVPFFHVDFLLPVLPDGIKPVLHGAYRNFGFPYIEITLFSLLLPFVHKNEGKTLQKKMFSVLIIHGLLLIIAVVCTIMAFGPLASHLKYSLFQLARLINIREIVTRVESFIGIALVVGSYMKATISLFILKELLGSVFQLKNKDILIFPITLISLLLSLTMFTNELEFVEAVQVVYPLYTTVIVVLPLLFITIVTLIKGRE